MLDIRQIELAEEEQQKVSLNNTLATTERGDGQRVGLKSLWVAKQKHFSQTFLGQCLQMSGSALVKYFLVLSDTNIFLVSVNIGAVLTLSLLPSVRQELSRGVTRAIAARNWASEKIRYFTSCWHNAFKLIRTL